MIQSIDRLEEVLSEPTPAVVETMRRLEGDLVVLGVGGKIGPTLARMARRADEVAGVRRRIFGVARFSTPGLRERLEGWGIETIACDLLDRKALAGLYGDVCVPQQELAALTHGDVAQDNHEAANSTCGTRRGPARVATDLNLSPG